ncbi:HAMP domain-containing sensor histidine kinase [Streptomyces sp. RG80]|uniref:sensor histidine kinase n=1 Tax=Streptomyces sp. RG80 TaxID=3157340 RepID=UPI0033902F71
MTALGALRLLGRFRPATLRMRLTLLAAVLAVVPLTAAAAGVAVATRASLLQDAQQRSTRPDLSYAVVAEGSRRVLDRGKPVPECGSTSPTPRDHRQVGFCTYLYDLSTTKPSMPGNPSVHDRLTSRGALSLTPWTDPFTGPTPIRQANAYVNLQGYVVMVYSLESAQARLNTLIWSLIGGVPALTLLISGSTWWAVGRVLRPVETIRADFAELSAHHLDRRVPVPRSGDEVARLAATMNATLERLQSAVERQRQFTADASHELRTPLACLRTELELALNAPASADWPQVVRDAHQDTMRLQDLTEDLLLLARLDAERIGARPDRGVDLTDLVREETARRRTTRDLTVDVQSVPGPVTVDGHSALLARVLGNLLDNAVRHASSTVTVRLTHDTDQGVAIIDVQDDGAGIPAQDHERVFERFTRLDNARARDRTGGLGGTGLGLAIAHRIATAHDGTLTVTPSPRGAHFTLRLPCRATWSNQ